jgi:hypothetical protein
VNDECRTLELGLNKIFLGLNKIDFFGIFRILMGIRMDVRILGISPIGTDAF